MSSTRRQPKRSRNHRRHLRLENLEDRRLLTLVTIEPSNYSGQYCVSGQACATGRSDLDLAPGTYSLDNSAFIGGSAFTFNVEANGNVTTQNPDAATVSGNTLTMMTRSVTIDPTNYPSFALSGFGQNLFTGQQTFHLIADLRYTIDNGAFIGGSTFAFDVAANGNVTSQNEAAASVNGNTLTLITTPITIDPANYPSFAMTGFGQTLFAGEQTFNVMPGLRHTIDNGFFTAASAFAIDVDTNGNVSSLNTVAATGSANRLTISNTAIRVDPNDFVDTYEFFGSHTGTEVSTLIPGMGGYSVRIQNQIAFDFSVDGKGNPTPVSAPVAVNGENFTFLLSNAERHWQGDVDTNWSTADNWLENQLPINGDVIVIDSNTAGFTSLVSNNDLVDLTVDQLQVVNDSGSQLQLTGNAIRSQRGITKTGGNTVIGLNQITMLANQTFDLGGTSSTRVDSAIDTAGFTLTITGDIEKFFDGVISGDGGVTVVDGQTTKLRAANTYTGLTYATRSTLGADTTGALGSTANGTTVGNLGALSVAANNAEVITMSEDYPSMDVRKDANQVGQVVLDNPLIVNFGYGSSSAGDATISGVISGTAQEVRFTSPAGSNMVLTGNNNYVGPTQIRGGGKLVVENTLTASQVTVLEGTLAGSGQVAGQVSVSGSSKVSPGTGAGILGTGSLTLTTGSQLEVELEGTTAGSGYDQLNITGTVNLGGATLQASRSFAPDVGTSFTIINNDGTDAVVGQFNGLAEGATLAVDNRDFTISYAGDDGNDVVLTAIPTQRHWQGDVDTNWSTADNWLENQVPINGDVIVIDTNTAGFTSLVSNNDLVDMTVDQLQLVNDSGSQSLLQLTGNAIRSQGGITKTGGNTVIGLDRITMLADQMFDLSGSFSTTVDSDIDLAGFTLTITGARNKFFRGVISGAGGVAVTDGADTWFNATNTYAGLTEITRSIVGIQLQGTLGSAAGATVLNDSGNLVISGEMTNQDQVVMAGALSELRVRKDSLQAGNIVLNNPPSARIAYTSSATGDATISGDISGTAQDVRFTSPAGSNVVLTGNNNYVGPTEIRGGGGLVVQNSLTSSQISVLGSALKAGGSATMSSSTINIDATGTLELHDHDVSIGGLSGPGSVVLGSGTLTTGVNDSSTTFDGVISGTGGIIHDGAGTLTLTNVQNYSGITDVVDGNLRLEATARILASNPKQVGTAGTITFVGTAVADTFVVQTGNHDSTRVIMNDESLGDFYVTGKIVIQCGAGNDTVSIAASGDQGITVFGEAGTDTTTVQFGELSGLVSIEGDNLSDNDALIVNGTDQADEIDVTNTLVARKIAVPRTVSYTKTANVTVNGGGGDDSITIDGSQTIILGGDGNDTIAVLANGPSGLEIDGQDGSDSYQVTFGELDGDVTFADSGTSGADALVVAGSPGADAMVLDGDEITNLGESVQFSSAFEQLQIETTGSEDQLVVETAAVAPLTVAGVTEVVIQGTANDDTIRVEKRDTSGELEPYLNGTSQGVFANVQKVVAHGLSGNDKIEADASITTSLWFYGGPGDDKLKGAQGNDVLLGEDGADFLVGKTGRDFLVGGSGSDRIVGNADDDILIAGALAFDDLAEAIKAITEEWTSQRDYQTRVANISGNGDASRLNGQYYLTTIGENATVEEDGARDVLTGSAGQDWFFANLAEGVRDKITDLHDEEFAQDLMWILE